MKTITPFFALLALTACVSETGPAATDRGRLALSDNLSCRVLADIGRELKADNYDPSVLGKGGTIDCHGTFAAAGLPMLEMDRRIRFDAPQFTGHDAAQVRVDFVCLRLCGHGEQLSLQRHGDTWTMVARKTTWIS